MPYKRTPFASTCAIRVPNSARKRCKPRHNGPLKSWHQICFSISGADAGDREANPLSPSSPIRGHLLSHTHGPNKLPQVVSILTPLSPSSLSRGHLRSFNFTRAVDLKLAVVQYSAYLHN